VATTPASADTAPPNTALPATVSTDSLPTAQINGVVWDQVVIGNTVFVGGSFSTARPAGAAAGTSTVTRTNILSYSLSSGTLTSWAPSLNGQVRAMDASPDGKRLYVVGAFTSVNGATRNRIVAFDTATGAVISSFAASANAEVFAVTASAGNVYFGGQFSQVSGVSRPGRAASVTAATGAVRPWAPVLSGGRAYAMEVAPDESKVVIAGNFTSLNGSSNPGYGLGAVTTTSGSNLTWSINSIIRNAGTDAAIYSLDSDATSVYGTGYTLNDGGDLEGTWRASWSSGALEWVQDCQGDEYSVAALGSVVYIAGHPHTCASVGGFPETEPKTWHRGLAFTRSALEKIQTGIFWGKPQPTLLQFFSTFNTGTYTGQSQGPWSVAGNSSYVVYAGEFTKVNDVGQQGLARFAVSSIAPKLDGPSESAGKWPLTAIPAGKGAVRIVWPTNHDRDNEQLTYRLIRDGNTASPIYTVAKPSSFWNRPNAGFVDTGLASGSSHSYRVSATDPFGRVAWSNTVTTTAGSSGSVSSYMRSVLASGPTYYYRLGESSGSATNFAGPTANTTASGGVTQNTPATVGTGVTRNTAGAIAGDSNTSMRFNNGSSSRVYTTQQVWSDDSLSVETWFRTSTSSGKMVGFGNSSSSSNSSTFDRHLYLYGGRVMWGAYDGANRVIQSNTGYNDGKWHHAVGSISSAGMALYIDGQLVATRASTVQGRRYWGNWHIGGDSTWAGNQNFDGYLDEVAVYKVPLTASQVSQHYQAGIAGTTAAAEPAPEPAPEPATGTIAQDGFSRTVSSGWGTADAGGAWSAASTSYSVSSGSAAASHSVGSTRRSLLTSTSATNTTVTVDVAIDKAATGGGVTVGAVGRQIGSAFYQARVRFNADGSLNLQILNGSSTVLANTSMSGITYSPGQQIRLRVQTAGTNPTTIRAKAWPVSASEPANWMLTATDTASALQGAGSVGVESYLSGSATNAPVTVRYDNFLATTP